MASAICFVCVVLVGCYWNPRKKRQISESVPELNKHHSAQSAHSNHCHFNSPRIIIDENHVKMEELKLRVYRHNSNNSRRSSRQSLSQQKLGVHTSFQIHRHRSDHQHGDDVNLSETMETADSFSNINIGIHSDIINRDLESTQKRKEYGGIVNIDIDDLDDLDSNAESDSDELLFTASNRR